MSPLTTNFFDKGFFVVFNFYVANFDSKAMGLQKNIKPANNYFIT